MATTFAPEARRTCRARACKRPSCRPPGPRWRLRAAPRRPIARLHRRRHFEGRAHERMSVRIALRGWRRRCRPARPSSNRLRSHRSRVRRLRQSTVLPPPQPARRRLPQPAHLTCGRCAAARAPHGRRPRRRTAGPGCRSSASFGPSPRRVRDRRAGLSDGALDRLGTVGDREPGHTRRHQPPLDVLDDPLRGLPIADCRT